MAVALLFGVIIFALWQTRAAMNPTYSTFWHDGSAAENRKFTLLTDEFFHDAYKNSPLSLHLAVKDLEKYGFTRPEMDLFARSGVNSAQTLKRLKAIKRGRLSRENQITYDVMMDGLSDASRNSYPFLSYFGYSDGVQTSMLIFAIDYRFFVEEDITDYLTLISQIPSYFSYLYEWEEKRVNAGYGLSDRVLADVREQFVNIYEEGENSCFISSFEAKTDAFEGISAEKKEEYKAQNREIVLNKVLPAYRATEGKLAAFTGMGTNDGGLCGFGNDGKKYYEKLLKSEASYSGSPDALYNELYAFAQEQYDDFTRVAQSQADTYQRWKNKEERGMSEANEILDFFSERITEEFPAIESTTYTVNYLSESVAAAMSKTLAYYRPSPIDSYRNGMITVNGYADGADDMMMNTLAHEGYPGHLYQDVYFKSKNPDPVRTCFSFSGYTEGWAVYAANRAEYIYGYNGDTAYALLNEKQTSISYALSALVDIGVHYYGWDQAATEAMLRNFSDMPYTTDIRGLAERMRNAVISMPGTYLSYGAGNMQMLALRSYAEAAEGEDFDVVDFHRLVLDIGACNFATLRKMTEEYYDMKNKRE
ncbi:MAG: DUF885 domain-containing protein [Clostridia bacterium]|nr:DUF885 domain-containing protein [Clostridia bacterium]